jgi:hypothetical protein
LAAAAAAADLLPWEGEAAAARALAAWLGGVFGFEGEREIEKVEIILRSLSDRGIASSSSLSYLW